MHNWSLLLTKANYDSWFLCAEFVDRMKYSQFGISIFLLAFTLFVMTVGKEESQAVREKKAKLLITLFIFDNNLRRTLLPSLNTCICWHWPHSVANFPRGGSIRSHMCACISSGCLSCLFLSTMYRTLFLVKSSKCRFNVNIQTFPTSTHLVFWLWQ